MEAEHPLSALSDMLTPLTGAFHLVITNPSFRWSTPRDVAEHTPCSSSPPEIRAHTPGPQRDDRLGRHTPPHGGDSEVDDVLDLALGQGSTFWLGRRHSVSASRSRRVSIRHR
jgi:hypothetical protein